ncbi:MAG: cobyric acid synthase [SAR324 cluster bacterium]|nr:cobyric acid synthase [SAR324 cluster bacterium]
MTQVIMFQGTGSGVGKSIIAAGFCRLLANRGIKVAPFKAQNMALNSGVTMDGLEMGRAQFLQAEAARIAPDVRMNPILLKPQGNHRSQLVRLGKVVGTYRAQEYYQLAEENFEIVKSAFDSLLRDFDVVIIEGAGSPAEINLQRTDIVNMRMADYAQASVFIIGDIDRGGVFAWLKGTYDLIQDTYKPLIKGFIINKFRGDYSLLAPGIELFASMVPVKTVGTLPYMKITLEDEDSQNISSQIDENARIKIGVIRLPYISNFTDFSPLKMLDDVSLHFVEKASELDEFDIIVLPGSKDTLNDLMFLKETGFFEKLQDLFGQKLMIGICGGFQMMGRSIADPDGMESSLPEMEALNFIEMKTVIGKEKILNNQKYQGKGLLEGIVCAGYEIHMGTSLIDDPGLEQIVEKPDTFIWKQSKRLLGTYIHGLFDSLELTQRILHLFDDSFEVRNDFFEEKEKQLNALAASLEKHCDLNVILQDQTK